jgi:arylsulfatase A-like enzyme
MRLGMKLGAGAAIGLWLGDVVVLAATYRPVGSKRWLTGVSAALFVALTTALVLGAVLGPLLVSMLSGPAAVLRTRWRGLREAEGNGRRAVTAQVLGAAGVLGLWSWCAYRVALAAELRFAGPKSMAGALTLSHLMFAATLAVAWPSGVRWARMLLDGTSRLPGLRWLTARPWRLPCLLGVGTLIKVGVGAVAHRAELSELPWRSVVSAPGILVGLAAAAFLSRAPLRWRGALVRAGFALTVVGLLGGSIAAVRLQPESTMARKIAFEQMLSGRLGYAAWTAAFDFDGDGQLGILGGGDCAPFDAHRYTGALNTSTGAHEDCDNVDLTPIAIAPRPRMQVGQSALPARPTLVLITVDALAAPRLGAPGGTASLMPHVSDFASRAALFTHCFAQGPSTRLSLPSMFTSRWDSELSHLFAPAHPFPLASSERQLQDVLAEAGYDTVAVIPNSYFDSNHWPSLTRGFQRVDVSAGDAGKHNAPQVTDAALRALSTDRERPLYLWVHYFDAHGPYLPIANAAQTHASDEALYAAEVSYIDRELDRLITALESRSDPTYAILTADHATVFHPEPSTRTGHYGFDLYTATLHVPLVVWGPGIKPGRVEDLVSTMDVSATIADLLHLPAAGYEGTSLLPEMLAGVRDHGRALFHEFYLPERGFRGEDPLGIVSVRTPSYNLVFDRTQGSYELYDWQNDYFEQHDLYEERARSPEVLHLRSLLHSFVGQFHRHWPGARLASTGGTR